MRSLTGIFAVDIVEFALLAGLAGYSSLRRSVTVRVWATIAVALLVVDIRGSALTRAAVVAAFLGLAVLIATDRPVRRVALVVGAACALSLGLTALAAFTVRGDVARARESLAEIRSDLATNDANEARRNITKVSAGLRHAHGRLNHPLSRPSRLVPFAGKQIGATKELLEAARDLVAAAEATVDKVDPKRLTFERGRLPVDRLHAMRRPADALAATAQRLADKVRTVQRTALASPLRELAAELHDNATRTARTARLLSALASNAPDLLGSEEPRRYFLLIQNPAEARGSGGILGAYAELVVDRGKVTLGAFGSDGTLNQRSGNRPRVELPEAERHHRLMPTRYWQNLTSSPDFATAAREVAAEYAAIGHPVDGVISVDPTALAAFLTVTGDVTVPDWPLPLSPANAVQVFEHDQYLRFAKPSDHAKRQAFMASAVEAIFSRLTKSTVPLAATETLGAAAARGHIAIHALRGHEQALFEDAGIAGAFPRADGGDVLAVTSHNTGADKLDWFATRRVTYQPTVRADGGVRAELTISIHNGTPAGEPAYVAGDPRSPKRDHLSTLLSVYTPWDLARAELDNRDTTATVDTELGHNVYSVELNIPPGATRVLRLTLTGRIPAGSKYMLTYRRQPLVRGDTPAVLIGDRLLVSRDPKSQILRFAA